MGEDEILSGLTDAVVNGKKDQAVELAQAAVDAGMDPFKAIIEGLAKGMEIMGEKYERKEAFMPHLMMASNAMYGGMDVLTPLLKKEGGEASDVLIIGEAEGDVHDIGKNLVKTMMTANGFEAIDLGKDVPIAEFAKAAAEHKAAVVSISTLMTSTMDNMEASVKALTDQGIRDKVVVMVGGAPITQAYADEIGADGTATDAMGAAKLAKELVKNLPEDRWN